MPTFFYGTWGFHLPRAFARHCRRVVLIWGGLRDWGAPWGRSRIAYLEVDTGVIRVGTDFGRCIYPTRPPLVPVPFTRRARTTAGRWPISEGEYFTRSEPNMEPVAVRHGTNNPYARGSTRRRMLGA